MVIVWTCKECGHGRTDPDLCLGCARKAYEEPLVVDFINNLAEDKKHGK